MAQKIVVDSSVITKWANQSNEDHLDAVDALLADVKERRIELLAPELAKYEIGNVLLKGKKLEPNEAYLSLATAYALPITFVAESLHQAQETFDIAYQMGITYYDAAFLSLAKQLEATLVTENVKHQKSVEGISVVALSAYGV